ncbi:MAG TPA: GH25 family lysozyme [Sphingobium sp.]
MVVLHSDPTRKRRIKVTPLRIIVAVVLAAALVGGGTFWLLRSWTPSRSAFPLQGITVSAETGAVNWAAVRLSGADFVYLVASSGRSERDATFAANLDGARAAGLKHGAIHRYSLCASATDQSTTFISTVPRDDAMLPPVVALAFSPLCPQRPSRDKLLAELNIFLNQIEAHAGKPAILRVTRDVEAAYDLSSGINRTLWLEEEFFKPGYATRPWVIWTASTWKRVPGIKGAVEWDVVRP